MKAKDLAVALLEHPDLPVMTGDDEYGVSVIELSLQPVSKCKGMFAPYSIGYRDDDDSKKVWFIASGEKTLSEEDEKKFLVD